MPGLIDKGNQSPLRQVDHFCFTEGESLLVTKGTWDFVFPKNKIADDCFFSDDHEKFVGVAGRKEAKHLIGSVLNNLVAKNGLTIHTCAAIKSVLKGAKGIALYSTKKGSTNVDKEQDLRVTNDSLL